MKWQKYLALLTLTFQLFGCGESSILVSGGPTLASQSIEGHWQVTGIFCEGAESNFISQQQIKNQDFGFSSTVSFYGTRSIREFNMLGCNMHSEDEIIVSADQIVTKEVIRVCYGGEKCAALQGVCDAGPSYKSLTFKYNLENFGQRMSVQFPHEAFDGGGHPCANPEVSAGADIATYEYKKI